MGRSGATRRPLTSTRSLPGLMVVPSCFTTSPLTRTAPDEIRASAWRREETPDWARYLCRRTARSGDLARVRAAGGRGLRLRIAGVGGGLGGGVGGAIEVGQQSVVLVRVALCQRGGRGNRRGRGGRRRRGAGCPLAGLG